MPRMTAELWATIGGLVILAAMLLLFAVGCADISRPLDQPPAGPAGPGADLAQLGRILLFVGGIGAVAGIAARLVLGFALGIAVAEFGVVALVSGFFLYWLGLHTWVVWVALGAAGMAWAWYRRAFLRRWLGRLPRIERRPASEILRP